MPIPKEEIKKILKAKGQINGMALLEDKAFVLDKFGGNGLRKVENEISKATGKNFSYSDIKSYTLYPIYFSALVPLIFKYDFNFSEDDIKKFGQETAKISLIIKLFLRTFISIKQISQQAGKIWKKYFNVGKLTIQDFDENKKYIIMDITDFDIHPLYCVQVQGAIHQLISYVIPSEKLKVEEIECTFRGGESHKFKITW